MSFKGNPSRAKAAVHRSWSRTEDRSARTANARTAALARFEREVDPDGRLAPAERARRAEHARKAHMLELSARGVAARRAKSKDRTVF